jgi:hypothetical protein
VSVSTTSWTRSIASRRRPPEVGTTSPATRYFDIDVDLVWSVAENDLPKLRPQIEAIVDQLP